MALKEAVVLVAGALTGLGIVVFAGALDERELTAAAPQATAAQTHADLHNEAIERGYTQARFAAQRHFLVFVQ